MQLQDRIFQHQGLERDYSFSYVFISSCNILIPSFKGDGRLPSQQSDVPIYRATAYMASEGEYGRPPQFALRDGSRLTLSYPPLLTNAPHLFQDETGNSCLSSYPRKGLCIKKSAISSTCMKSSTWLPEKNHRLFPLPHQPDNQSPSCLNYTAHREVDYHINPIPT